MKNCNFVQHTDKFGIGMGFDISTKREHFDDV